MLVPVPCCADGKRCNDLLQVLQYILLYNGLLLLTAFVVKAVATRLQFAGLHAPVWAFGYDGWPRKEKLPTNSA